MMTTKEKLYYFVKVVTSIVLFMVCIGFVTGCGIRDSAVVIPIGEVGGDIDDEQGTRDSAGAQDGAGTRDSAGTQGGAGTRDGAGAQDGAGMQGGAGTRGGAGTQGGAGMQSDAGTQGGTDTNRVADAMERSGVEITGADGMPDKQKAEPQAPMIYVYVCGCVNTPGVVELPQGSRAEAALEAAGGFTEEAWREYVNLAAPVTDGEKLYFPSQDEVGTWGQMELTKQVGQTNPGEQVKQTGLVNVNTAGLEELTSLPGIGEARARDIVAYREKHGNFERKEDLKKISGIKESVYSKLEDKIVVN